MKKTILILFLLIQFFNNVNSQVKYDTCQYLSQFAGEWRYVNGADTIRVYLRVNRGYDSDFNSIHDKLYGWHEYKQGNTIVESIYQNRFMDLSNADTITKRSFSIGLRMGDCSTSSKKAGGGIIDYLVEGQNKVVTVTLDATGTIMVWKQRNGADNGAFTGVYGMTLPKEFVLTKQ